MTRSSRRDDGRTRRVAGGDAGDNPVLKDVYLPPGPHERALLARLETQGMITVRELRTGLAIATTSFVGSIKIGPITVQIRPKIEGHAFSVLLGYALGLPHLELLPDHQIGLTLPAFQDLLADRLAVEAARLMSRGLFRHYRVMRGLSQARVAAFCSVASLERARNICVPALSLFRARRECLGESCPARGFAVGRPRGDRSCHSGARATISGAARRIRRDDGLESSTFRALQRGASRLTASYEPAFALIRLLMAGYGISTTHDGESIELPGFLFDMNLLFQEALGRFLRDWLVDGNVAEQYRLKDIFRYQPLFNPRRKHAPTPRPDYVISRGGHIVAIADAKYRDLWERDLPSGMLYQLSVMR